MIDDRQPDLENDLLLIKDMVTAAIRNGNSGEVEQLLENFYEAINGILKSFKTLSACYEDYT